MRFWNFSFLKYFLKVFDLVGTIIETNQNLRNTCLIKFYCNLRG